VDDQMSQCESLLNQRTRELEQLKLEVSNSFKMLTYNPDI